MVEKELSASSGTAITGFYGVQVFRCSPPLSQFCCSNIRGTYLASWGEILSCDARCDYRANLSTVSGI